MESAIRWLKASYLVGAVADGLIGVLMLMPSRMGETELRYAMGLGAALMFGWTALLLWAWRAPMERRGVLLLTIFPAQTAEATRPNPSVPPSVHASPRRERPSTPPA